MLSLETPPAGDPDSPDWSILYRARGDEVSASRPLFTGDVVEVEGQLYVVLQHPCALRKNGVNLVDRLLLAQVDVVSAAWPKNWHTNFRKSPLPQLKDGNDYEAKFLELEVVQSSDVEAAPRLASLSQIGVNVLLQRWVFHNSRAVIPLANYQEASGAEYEEADLTEDWVEERITTGLTVADATAEAHGWLRSNSPSGPRWQDLLDDPSTRSTVRVAMRKAIREL